MCMNNDPRIFNPFPPVFDENCRLLILGSLPSEKSREAGFYYMNPRNRFWPLISEILSEDLTAMSPEAKAAALLRHGVALSDVILSCEIHRSSDASIKDAKCTDIPYVLQHSKVERILLNGAKAHALFLKHFPQYASLAVCLPSTSPANARSGFENLLAAWRPYFRRRSLFPYEE